MASIGKDRNGRKRILFVDSDGSRKTVRLGKVTAKQAAAFKVRLEVLVGARFGGSIDDDTTRWLASLPDDVHGKLAAVGLVPPRASSTLGAFLDDYLANHMVKPQSLVVLGHTKRNLIAYFGADKALRDINEGDADGFRGYLRQEGLSEATVRRRIGFAKQFCKAALRRKLVPANPFADLPSASKANDQRQYFLSREDAQKVLEACPDSQWRLIVALARFGGLRTPSETLLLKWTDVDWDRGRITVHSPKTEHHEGHESRQIPLFPELRPYLLEVFEQAEPGTEYVITRYRKHNCNPATQFKRIIRKAGLEVWPKPFQNLRSTRETELTETYPLHVVTAWIGNSKAIAAKHYLQVRDTDFERAAQTPTGANGCAQNPAQYPAGSGGNDRNLAPEQGPESGDLLGVTSDSKSFPDKDLDRVGFEPT